jgi:hypothetical protein
MPVKSTHRLDLALGEISCPRERGKKRGSTCEIVEEVHTCRSAGDLGPCGFLNCCLYCGKEVCALKKKCEHYALDHSHERGG